MKKKYLPALLVVFILIFSLPVLAQTYISVATGGTAGVYYPLGGGMAELINEFVQGVNATAEVTGASVVNVRMLQNQEVELGLAQNDITFYAKTGTEMFKDDSLADLRGVALLYPEIIQMVTLQRTGINSVYDLAGKRVAVGAPGSGTEANARQILEAHGLTYSDITEDYLSFAEAVDQLRDGHVDAAFITAGIPTAAVIDLAATHNVKIISVEAEKVNVLREDYPFYTSAVIPGGTYSGINEDIHTVTVLAMIVTHANLSEEMVYHMTSAIFDNLDRLGEIHVRGKDVSRDTALRGMPIQLHPGALKYFTEYYAPVLDALGR